MSEFPLPGTGCAVFLDFDGTLADIAAHPQAVTVHADIPPLLAAVARALDGALAIVTGRPIAEIDHFLAPLRLPAAGVHGAERRAADGRWHHLPAPKLEEVLPALRAFVAAHAGLLLEEKSSAIALHYRQAPALESCCLAAMTEALQRLPDMALMRGKQVLEIKPRAAGKGGAVRAFLEEAPFQGRRPWFFGDDVTDEAAFEAVQALGGIAVKIGAGDTCACHRLASPTALQAWLRQALGTLTASSPAPR